MVNLEAQGIPGVFIASDVFKDGARGQANALGADPAAVYIPHPIQDRTDAEMVALADASFDEIVGQLVGG